MKLQTISEVCGLPQGSFQKFIEERERLQAAIEQHHNDRIKAVRNNQPVPELGFKAELWMVV